jgi:hypothetical protein
MTNQEIENKVSLAIEISVERGIAWLMSNGKKLTVANSEEEMNYGKSKGFWVASIYQNGNKMDI